MSDNKAIFKYAIQPGSQLAMSILRKKTFSSVGKLRCEYVYDDEPLFFSDRNNLTFAPLNKGEKWVKKLFGCALMHFTGRVPEKAKGKHVVLLLDVGGEACVLNGDGTPIAAITDVAPIEKNFHILRGKKVVEITPCAEGGEEIDVWLETGDNDFGIKDHGILKQADICVYREDIGELFYDVQNLALTKPYFPFYTKKHLSINRSLLRSYAALHGGGKAVARARKVLAGERKKGELNPYTVYAIGHGHLDLAFMWPIRETKRKEVRTFINQLNNIERYDEYVYGASQPQQFEWLETLSPDLFSRLQKAEKNNRLELQGGFWVETDTNIPSGESLVRQSLYGQKYWLEKFGHRAKICWLPDTFGFSGNLPQILKKSGMDYFITIKLSWGDTNKFPHHTFLWRGIDGSEILAHVPPEFTYSGEAMPINTFPAQKEYTEREKIPMWASLYGMGDGGAGPSIGHIESYLRQQDAAVLPTVNFSPLEKMFSEMENYRDVMVKYDGELYLEAHRGTYTTQNDIKKHNYLTEIALHNTEFLSVLTGAEDKEKMDEIWKEFLLYQFHDILPGTSIERVYKECFSRHQFLRDELNGMIAESLKKLSGDKLVALNSTSFSGKAILSYRDKLYQTELLSYGASDLRPLEDKPLLAGDNETIQNDTTVVRFAENGDIVSMTVNGKEFVKDYFGRFVIFTDIKTKFDAWDVTYSYLTLPKEEIVFSDPKVTLGCGYVCHEMSAKAGNSSFVRRVILRTGSPLVEMELDVDWHEEHRMLRVVNRPIDWEEEVLCHIQMGNIKRSTSETDPVEKAKFEICAHNWINVGKVSYLAKAKYGWRAKNGEISLNLLRAPTDPDPTCDRRKHTILFAYYPHEKEVFEAETPRVSYLYNNPPIITKTAAPIPSFVSADKRNVIVETIKFSENKKGVIVRLYESEGKVTSTCLTLSKQPKKATETNLLEDYISEIDLKNIPFKPYEIKTVYLEY